MPVRGQGCSCAKLSAHQMCPRALEAINSDVKMCERSRMRNGACGGRQGAQKNAQTEMQWLSGHGMLSVDVRSQAKR